MFKNKTQSDKPSWETSWKEDLSETIKTPLGANLASAITFGISGTVSSILALMTGGFNTACKVSAIICVTSAVAMTACKFWQDWQEDRQHVKDANLMQTGIKTTLDTVSPILE
jgi:hypothetical protein